jgi:hypothetical protein
MERPEPREKQVKKPYVAPVLKRYGDIETLTQGVTGSAVSDDHTKVG